MCAPDFLRSLRFHLAYCESCRTELEEWQRLQSDLRSLPRRRVPPDQALRLRVRVSQQSHRNVLVRLWVRLQNALQPVLLPASGGVLVAMICFGLLMGSEVVPANNIPDVPLRLVTPPRPSQGAIPSPWRELQELRPIDFSNAGDLPLAVVYQIDAEGRVVGYQVLSGQSSPELIHRLDRMIYFSVFQPATMFGMPTDGQVVLSLRRITVRG